MGERLALVARVSLQPVLPRPRMGALVRSDAAGPVLIHAHAREETGPRAVGAVGRPVVLAENPDRGLVLLDQHAAPTPVGHGGRGLLVARRQIEVDDVVGAPARQLGPHALVDHVVWRCDQVLERTRGRGVVAKRAQRLQVGHRTAQATASVATCRSAKRRGLVRSMWEHTFAIAHPPYLREKARRLRSERHLSVDEIAEHGVHDAQPRSHVL